MNKKYTDLLPRVGTLLTALVATVPTHMKRLLLALFFVVLGAKLLVISNYGSIVPYWDQWDGEAANLYIPYFDHTLTAQALFSPHNEHRYLVARLVSLILLLISGEWNPLLQMTFNAVLHSATITLLTAVLIQQTADRDRVSLVALSIVTFGLPAGWENTLSGFQFGFYFALFFAMTSFSLVTRSLPFSIGWWAAFATAVASYFSLASGTATFFIAAMIITAQNITESRNSRRDWLSAIAFGAGGIVCLIFLVAVPGHEPLKAKSISDFFSAFGWLSGFPFSGAMEAVNWQIQFLFSAAMLAPVCALVIAIVRQRRTSPNVWFIVAIFAFVGLQMASIAYSRAIGFAASRYLDLLLVMIPCSFATLSLIRMSRAVVALWAFALASSLVYFSIAVSFPEMAAKKLTSEQQLLNVKAFLATSDISKLQNKPLLAIPYPNADRLGALLLTAAVRATLPAELRPSDPETQNLRAAILTHPRLYGLVARLKNLLLGNSALIFALAIGLFVSSLEPLRSR